MYNEILEGKVEYTLVPAIRRFPVYLAFLLLISPVALVIALTGGVYKNKSGTAIQLNRFVSICCPITFTIAGFFALLL